jgi:hypothetical protein
LPLSLEVRASSASLEGWPQPRSFHVIASEAKQSRTKQAVWIASSLALLAMTVRLLSLLRRASKDDWQRRKRPSFEARKSAHLRDDGVPRMLRSAPPFGVVRC